MTKQVAPDSSVDDGTRERKESRYKKKEFSRTPRAFLMSHWVKNPPAMQETQETWI